MPDSVLFSVSGPRGINKEKVFYRIRQLVQERHPDKPIVFLDKIISKVDHPLHWTTEELREHPTTRLLDAFVEFNRSMINRVSPALRAIARARCPEEKRAAFLLHHEHLVPARVVIPGLTKPKYLIPITPRVSASNVYALHAQQEMQEIEKYFDGTGQNPPIMLHGEVEECAECALEQLLAALPLLSTKCA
jgi:hypothetical protein